MAKDGCLAWNEEGIHISGCACASSSITEPRLGLPAWLATSHPHTARLHMQYRACFQYKRCPLILRTHAVPLGLGWEGNGSKATKHIAHKKEYTGQTSWHPKKGPMAGGSHRLYFCPGACCMQQPQPPHKMLCAAWVLHVNMELHTPRNASPAAT
eukprot:scaffold32924_cov23-Tisochrysis_lutea.AAC.1